MTTCPTPPTGDTITVRAGAQTYTMPNATLAASYEPDEDGQHMRITYTIVAKADASGTIVVTGRDA